MQELKMDAGAIESLLYRESGLLGVSGVSSDMRELLESSNPQAKVAIDLFVYRIGRELGSLAAALGGLDAIVFTAGIGERAAAIRDAVCRQAIATNEEVMIAQHCRKLVGLGRERTSS
jgi:acetate kinase